MLVKRELEIEKVNKKKKELDTERDNVNNLLIDL